MSRPIISCRLPLSQALRRFDLAPQVLTRTADCTTAATRHGCAAICDLKWGQMGRTRAKPDELCKTCANRGVRRRDGSRIMRGLCVIPTDMQPCPAVVSRRSSFHMGFGCGVLDQIPLSSWIKKTSVQSLALKTPLQPHVSECKPVWNRSRTFLRHRNEYGNSSPRRQSSAL